MSSLNEIPVNDGAINGSVEPYSDVGGAVVISPLLIESEQDFPFTHARIGYHNLVASSTVSATNETAGFEADAVQNTMTYERWKTDASSATLTIEFESLDIIDYIGLASHNLSVKGVTVTAQYSTNGTDYTDLNVSITPETDTAIMMLFPEVAATHVQLVFTGGSFTLGVVYAGVALQMYRAIYSGHAPDHMGRSTTLKPNTSVGGAFLGRSKLRQGYSNKYEWDKTPVDWYNENVEPFSKAALDDPFFIAWNPLEHPDDCLYCWCNEDISPELSGVLNFVSFSFSVEGIGHD